MTKRTMSAKTAKPAADPLAPLRAKVQVLRRQVHTMADDETWRAFLGLVAGGVTSTRAMTERQLRDAVEALHKAGAPRTAAARAKAPAKRRYTDTAQLGKIRALWVVLAAAGKLTDPSDRGMEAFVRRQTGQDIGVLSPADARGVIESLKAWCRRVGVAHEG